jgi:ion channel-forming bestrophin family protein
MIIRANRSWLSLVFTVRKGTLLEEIWLRILFVVALSVVATVLHESYGIASFGLTMTPFTIVGFAVSIFMGFRNSSAYDRFWEGRKLWGGLVNVSRSLGRQIALLPRAEPRDEPALRTLQARFADHLAAFAHLLRAHLRKESLPADIKRLCGAEVSARVERADNRPLVLLAELSLMLQEARAAGWLDSFAHIELERGISEMTNIQGACERIRSTPIPLSHTALTHRTIAAYLVLLPFGLVDTVELMTPIVTLLIAFAFFGLDSLGEEMEDPFGTDCNDLPLHLIASTIERNLAQQRGIEPLPELPAPVNNILL